MPKSWVRRRAGWILLGAAAGLLMIMGGAAGLYKLDLERFEGNSDRMRKLQEAPLVSLGLSSSEVGEWPQWRGPNRNGLSLETGLLTAWPTNGPPVRWEHPIGRGFSSPVVANGHVYTMVQDAAPGSPETGVPLLSHEAVVCWDAETGKEVWRCPYPSRYEERMGSGPRSTPVIDGNSIYAVGPTGILHCLRADTGEKIWRHDLLEEFQGKQPQYGVSFSPLVEGDLVFALPGGTNESTVAAFDKRDGTLIWRALDDPVGYSSPIAVSAAGVRQVLVLSNKSLVSLSPREGKVYWRYAWETANGFNIATPIAFGNYVFLSSGYSKGCALLEIAADATGSLCARPVYEHNRMRNYFASSVCYQGHIYGFDNTDLVCMAIRTGQILWREKGIRSFKKGSLLIADGHLIVLGEYGRLSLAEATPEGYREKSVFQVSQNKCWTVPVLAGGRLYVRDESCLRCLDLRE